MTTEVYKRQLDSMLELEDRLERAYRSNERLAHELYNLKLANEGLERHLMELMVIMQHNETIYNNMAIRLTSIEQNLLK